MFVNVKARVFTDATGVYTEMPALLTPSGVLEPLVDYFLVRDDRSINWMIKTVRAVRMFLEYLHANPGENDPRQLFVNFAQRLYTGTANRDTGLDSSGLCWRRRSAQDARHIIIHLSDFLDWLSETRPVLTTVNRGYAGSAYDQLVDEKAYQYRRNKAFLGHLWDRFISRVNGHRVRARRLPIVQSGNPPAFPEERFMDLLLKGFKVCGHYDYRSMLITLLLHGGGFRESEPFHLYVGDVHSVANPPNENRAVVRIHHPTYGAAPADWLDALGLPKLGTRAAYLAERYGLVPRTELMDCRGAGWKGGMHDGLYYKETHWFPLKYGELFFTSVAALPRTGSLHLSSSPLRVHQSEMRASRRNVLPAAIS